MRKWFSQQSPATRVILLAVPRVIMLILLAVFLDSSLGATAAVGGAFALATDTPMGTMCLKVLGTTAGYLHTIMVIPAYGVGTVAAVSSVDLTKTVGYLLTIMVISAAGLAVSGTISILRNNHPGDGSDDGGETA